LKLRNAHTITDTMTLLRQICLIEELAANAWPAEVAPVVSGWRLRFSGGVTSRANSVWPNDDTDLTPLQDKLAAAERFYAARGEPARFQICPACQPANLDEILAQRGYQTHSLTSVQIAPLDTVLSRLARNPALPVEVRGVLSDDWFEVYARAGNMEAHERAMRRGILSRIGMPAGFALARLDDQPAAVGLCVVERGWAGIFCMETLPALRRRGAASAILRALGDWACAQGATQAYLQVVDANTPAVTLYARAGFQTLYHYHYRALQP
jgi:GNAT superfamily N-acetyltransferase